MSEPVITWQRLASGEYAAQTPTHRLYVIKVYPSWNRGKADWKWELVALPGAQPGGFRTGRSPTMRKAKAAAAEEYRRQRST